MPELFEKDILISDDELDPANEHDITKTASPHKDWSFVPFRDESNGDVVDDDDDDAEDEDEDDENLCPVINDRYPKFLFPLTFWAQSLHLAIPFGF